MSLVFYYAPMSTATITAAVLAELKQPHDIVELDINAGDTRSAEFLSINPNGRVPVIVHDGTVIWESAAITMYLGEVFGVAAGLYPAAGLRRGVAMKWIVWTNTVLAEAAGRLAAALPAEADGAVQSGSVDYAEPDASDAESRRQAETDIALQLGILNAALASETFILGEYSLADTHLYVVVAWLTMMDIELAAFENLPGWMTRCGQRPQLAQMFGG